MPIRAATSRAASLPTKSFYSGPFASRRAAEVFAESFLRSFQDSPLPDQNPPRSEFSRLHLFGNENVPRAMLRGLHAEEYESEVGRTSKRWKPRERRSTSDSTANAPRQAKRWISSVPRRCTRSWRKFPRRCAVFRIWLAASTSSMRSCSSAPPSRNTIACFAVRAGVLLRHSFFASPKSPASHVRSKRSCAKSRGVCTPGSHTAATDDREPQPIAAR